MEIKIRNQTNYCRTWTILNSFVVERRADVANCAERRNHDDACVGCAQFIDKP